MGRFDIAIIGAGPGGISAAITAKIRGKSTLFLGKRGGGKLEKAHAIQNYPGFPNVSGADLSKAFMDHIDSMGIEITEARVSMVYPMGDYFSIQAGENIYEATTVILATGVVAGKT
nr:NAD(P)/FAD-dependent oxidoreductase [Lachnospiraceae bacterium]